MTGWLDQRTRTYLTVFGCSIVAGVIFYFLGGGTGRLFTNDAVQGWGFEIGGAAVGFFIAFLLSARFFHRQERAAPSVFDLKLSLKGKPVFPKKGEFVVSYEVSRRGKPVKQEKVQPDYPFPNCLVVWIRDVLPADQIVAWVEQADGRTWKVDTFMIIEPVLDARAKDARAKTASATTTAEASNRSRTGKSLSHHAAEAPLRELETAEVFSRPASGAPAFGSARPTARKPGSATSEETRPLGKGR